MHAGCALEAGGGRDIREERRREGGYGEGEEEREGRGKEKEEKGKRE